MGHHALMLLLSFQLLKTGFYGTPYIDALIIIEFFQILKISIYFLGPKCNFKFKVAKIQCQ